MLHFSLRFLFLFDFFFTFQPFLFFFVFLRFLLFIFVFFTYIFLLFQFLRLLCFFRDFASLPLHYITSVISSVIFIFHDIFFISDFSYRCFSFHYFYLIFIFCRHYTFFIVLIDMPIFFAMIFSEAVFRLPIQLCFFIATPPLFRFQLFSFHFHRLITLHFSSLHFIAAGCSATAASASDSCFRCRCCRLPGCPLRDAGISFIYHYYYCFYLFC